MTLDDIWTNYLAAIRKEQAAKAALDQAEDRVLVAREAWLAASTLVHRFGGQLQDLARKEASPVSAVSEGADDV